MRKQGGTLKASNVERKEGKKVGRKEGIEEGSQLPDRPVCSI